MTQEVHISLSVNKVLLEHSIHLHVACGCFCATTRELSSCDRLCGLQSLTYDQALYRKVKALGLMGCRCRGFNLGEEIEPLQQRLGNHETQYGTVSPRANLQSSRWGHPRAQIVMLFSMWLGFRYS